MLNLLNVLRKGSSDDMLSNSIWSIIVSSLNEFAKRLERKIYLEAHTGNYKLHKTNIIDHIGKAYLHQKTPTFISVGRHITLPMDSSNWIKKLVDDIQWASITSITIGRFQLPRCGIHWCKIDMKGSFVFKCNHCQKNKGGISYNSTKQFRNLSIHNDRKNNTTDKERKHPRKGKI